MDLAFTKMEGCGNDYVYIDCFQQSIENPAALSIKVSDRHFGIGGDGLILICPSEIADAKMRMFNADGSEGKMCGNGIRCVGKYIHDYIFVGMKKMRIETQSGVKTVEVEQGSGSAESLRVDMGEALLKPECIPVKLEGDQIVDREIEIDSVNYRVSCVSMGNPHAVIFVENPDALKLEEIGPKFEFAPIFPEQVNTEFVQILGPQELKMRVWERGSGETLACGTGACAVAVAAVLNGFCTKEDPIFIHLRGGDLSVSFDEADHVILAGKAVEVFQGIIKV